MMLSVWSVLEDVVEINCWNGCGYGSFERKKMERNDGKTANGGASCTICRSKQETKRKTVQQSIALKTLPAPFQAPLTDNNPSIAGLL
jgi:hypothetical protein